MNALSCRHIVGDYLEAVGSRFSCYEQDGRLWVVSPFAYPDQDLIEVTVRLLLSGGVLVSDLGETLRHLANQGFDPRATPKGQYLVAQIAKQHGVELDRGMVKKVAPVSEVGVAAHDVITACLAIAHLVVLSRAYSPATFREEVSHFLTEQGAGFEPDHHEIGLTGKKYTIDFFIPGRERDGLMQALSPSNVAGSTSMVNANFRLWSDVPNGRWRASLIDDRTIRWRPEDVALLKRVSEVYPWSEREESFRRDLAQFAAG